jgi:hypothetical protein
MNAENESESEARLTLEEIKDTEDSYFDDFPGRARKSNFI